MTTGNGNKGEECAHRTPVRKTKAPAAVARFRVETQWPRFFVYTCETAKLPEPAFRGAILLVRGKVGGRLTRYTHGHMHMHEQ